jgi:hypothetical protein
VTLSELVRLREKTKEREMVENWEPRVAAWKELY